MGLEWRIFMPASKEDFIQFSKLTNVEIRNDIYILLPSPQFGLKLRNNTIFELKVRQYREDSGIEKWKKKIKTTILKQNSPMNNSKLILQIIKDYKEYECAIELEKMIQENKVIYANVEKYRIDLNIDGLREEQVLLEISFFGNNEIMNKKVYYKSICIEGKSIMSEKGKKRRNEFKSFKPMGYNEFLFNLYKIL